MATRRDVIKTGVVASAAPASALAGFAARAATPVLIIYKAVYDERFADGRTYAAQAAARGWATAAVRGDVTDLWFHDLSQRWKQGAAPIAGLTTEASLFCLEQLARDAGMRVVSRQKEPGQPLVYWLIAPTRRS